MIVDERFGDLHLFFPILKFDVDYPSLVPGYGQITDKYRYRPIYRLSADISVLQIREMLIGIGYRYRPI